MIEKLREAEIPELENQCSGSPKYEIIKKINEIIDCINKRDNEIYEMEEQHLIQYHDYDD